MRGTVFSFWVFSLSTVHDQHFNVKCELRYVVLPRAYAYPLSVFSSFFCSSVSLFPFLASWAVMSYPEIQSLVLDASFDDLLPLALKVMPDSWSES